MIWTGWRKSQIKRKSKSKGSLCVSCTLAKTLVLDSFPACVFLCIGVACATLINLWRTLHNGSNNNCKSRYHLFLSLTSLAASTCGLRAFIIAFVPFGACCWWLSDAIKYIPVSSKNKVSPVNHPVNTEGHAWWRTMTSI